MNEVVQTRLIYNTIECDVHQGKHTVGMRVIYLRAIAFEHVKNKEIAGRKRTCTRVS
jgi:hypothetical protein